MGRWRVRTTGSTLVLAAALLLLSTGCAVRDTGSASCPGTTIDLGAADLRPGGSVELTVDRLHRTCEDGGGTFRRSDDVTVTITPSATGRSVLIGRPVPRGGSFTVSGRFDLPDDLPRGDAVLGVHSHDGDGSGADLPVTIH